MKVTLIDRENTIDSRPRTVHLTAPGIQVLSVLVSWKMFDALVSAEGLTYQKLDGTPIVTVEDFAMSRSPEATIVLPIGMLCEKLLSHAESNSKIFLKWSHRVVDVGPDENSAWANIKEQDGTEKRIRGDFLCGCDEGLVKRENHYLKKRNS